MRQSELNAMRAKWGKAALAGHLNEKKEAFTLTDETLSDTICDLIHYAESEGFDGCHLAARALGNFVWEHSHPDQIVD